MEARCTTCHLVQTDDSKTLISLAMPKEQLCFACHEKAAILQKHTPAIKESCVSCHDSHSSDYPWLLSAKANAEYRTAGLRPARKATSQKAGSHPRPRSAEAMKARGAD
jgi:predicted CXXCH cytochrome family protein